MHPTFYSIVPNGLYSTFTICRNEPLSFDVFTKYTKEVKNVFKEHTCLLKEDLSLSLFETSSILDYVKPYLFDKEDWVDYERVMKMSGDELTDIFESYILEDNVPSWLLVSRHYSPKEMHRIFHNRHMSDEEILHQIMFLSFDTIKGERVRISPQRISSLSSQINRKSIYIFDRKINLARLLVAVRTRYGVGHQKAMTIKEAQSYAIDDFLTHLSNHSVAFKEKLICSIKYANSAKSILPVLKQLYKDEKEHIPNGGSAGGVKDGYQLDSTYNLNSPSIHIGRYNFILQYLEEATTDDSYVTVRLYEGFSVWELVYEHFKGATLF
ncbi:MAG: Unknown protein [uncultured Sulfurovum sp.]|uniref:Uncharacterized protein n=1 Tax=uncultured Sulfurovum sp. TaxID=269237 RepID=A0A6S6ST02_9BACT|nr:MAG: Unknown protein [uncultured Sulfurovum sp.]